jgi:hypothetical protein
MEPIFRTILTGSREMFATIARLVRNLFRRLRPGIGDFGSLTICPSCGRITSKYKTSCLECGKLLKTV